MHGFVASPYLPLSTIPASTLPLSHPSSLATRSIVFPTPFSSYLIYSPLLSSLYAVVVAGGWKQQNMFFFRNPNSIRKAAAVVAKRVVLLGVSCLLGYTLQFFGEWVIE